MTKYYTSGQIADSLRVSSATLKRWLQFEEIQKAIPDQRNSINWRLFTLEDLNFLYEFKKKSRKSWPKYKVPMLIQPRN